MSLSLSLSLSSVNVKLKSNKFLLKLKWESIPSPRRAYTGVASRINPLQEKCLVIFPRTIFIVIMLLCNLTNTGQDVMIGPSSPANSGTYFHFTEQTEVVLLSGISASFRVVLCTCFCAPVSNILAVAASGSLVDICKKWWGTLP